MGVIFLPAMASVVELWGYHVCWIILTLLHVVYAGHVGAGSGISLGMMQPSVGTLRQDPYHSSIALKPLEDVGDRGSPPPRKGQRITCTFLLLPQPCLRHEVSHLHKFFQSLRDGQQSLTRVTSRRHQHNRRCHWGHRWGHHWH